jgi:hypothetical protein
MSKTGQLPLFPGILDSVQGKEQIITLQKGIMPGANPRFKTSQPILILKIQTGFRFS